MTTHTTSARSRALSALRRGRSFRVAARAVGVSPSTVERWATAAGVVSARRQRPLRLATLRAAVARATSQRTAVLLAVAVAHRARDTRDPVELHAVWSALDASGMTEHLADARLSDLVAAGYVERGTVGSDRAVRLTAAGEAAVRRAVRAVQA